MHDIKSELAAIDGGGAPDADADDGLIAAARDDAARARKAANDAESTRRGGAGSLAAADAACRLAETALTRLKAEIDALIEVLGVGDDDLWPPLIDAITVETAPGSRPRSADKLR